MNPHTVATALKHYVRFLSPPLIPYKISADVALCISGRSLPVYDGWPLACLVGRFQAYFPHSGMASSYANALTPLQLAICIDFHSARPHFVLGALVADPGSVALNTLTLGCGQFTLGYGI